MHFKFQQTGNIFPDCSYWTGNRAYTITSESQNDTGVQFVVSVDELNPIDDICTQDQCVCPSTCASEDLSFKIGVDTDCDEDNSKETDKSADTDDAKAKVDLLGFVCSNQIFYKINGSVLYELGT